MKKRQTLLKILPLGLILVGPIGLSIANAQEEGGFIADKLGGALFALFEPLVAIIILPIGSLIVGLAGTVLNLVLDYTVVNMAQNISAISAINVAWAAIRDLANMCFIFFLLYIAIGTILGIGVNWKKTLINVVIAALLINFSIFFTKVIIDASNIITLFFYEQVAPNASGEGTGLSNHFMDALRLSSVYDANGLSLAGKTVVTGIFGFILMLVAGFVFVAAAIMFVIRYITLIFLLILSPIALAATALPKLGKISGQWWSQLWGQAIFAPVFMILSWVVLKIVKDQNFFQTDAQFSDITVSTTGAAMSSTVGLVLNFCIVIAFMIATLIISKQVSNQGGSAAEKFVGKAIGMASGGAAYVGRRTIGSAGRSVADSEALKERASQKGLRGAGARLALRASQGTAKASFDVRNPLESGFKRMNVKGPDFGKAQKGGYDQYIKDEAKKKEDFAKGFGPSDIKKDQLKQAVEREKQVVVNAQGEVDNIDAEIRKIRREWDKNPDNIKNDPTMLAAFNSNLSKLQNTRGEKQKVLDEAKRTHENRVNVAQFKADKTLGIKKDEAERRNKAIIEKLKKEAPGLTDEEYTRRMKALGLEVKETKGAEDRRKESYARTISEPGIFGTSRVGLLGKIKKQNLQAAAKIRGGKKSVEDRLKDILKDEGELKEPEKKEESPTTGGGAPATA